MNHVQELEIVANEVETLDNSIENKKASLINPGDKIVCLNPVQGIFKGRVYLADEVIEPNVLIVSELDGTQIGAFQSNRFCLSNNEY
jgi:hypothetical protein